MIGLPSSTWAMEPEALSRLYAKPSALESVRPHTLEKGAWDIGLRNRTAVVYITGPLFKRDSWLTRKNGATTYEAIAQQFRRALDHRDVESIALYVDSPGGEANGCDELAAMIYAARDSKAVTAYISGAGCSAAYWIASAAKRVVVSDLAIVGSLGVAQAYENRSAADEKEGVRRVDFVSSQSPNKGFAPDRIQKMVDDLAAVFVGNVAKHRGVTSETIVKRFGQGGIEVGKNAVRVGMADATGSFESVLAGLQHQPVPIRVKPLSARRPDPDPEPTRRAPPAAPVQLTAAERARAKADAEAVQRVRDICQSPEGLADPDRAATLAFETRKTAADAVAAMRQAAIDNSWRRAAQNLEV